MSIMATKDADYDPTIIHEPKDVDPNGPVAKVIKLLKQTLRLTLRDGRLFEGIFTAFDKFANIVLIDVDTYFEDIKHRAKTVIVPLDYLDKVEMIEPRPERVDGKTEEKVE